MIIKLQSPDIQHSLLKYPHLFGPKDIIQTSRGTQKALKKLRSMAPGTYMVHKHSCKQTLIHIKSIFEKHNVPLFVDILWWFFTGRKACCELVWRAGDTAPRFTSAPFLSLGLPSTVFVMQVIWSDCELKQNVQRQQTAQQSGAGSSWAARHATRLPSSACDRYVDFCHSVPLNFTCFHA